MKIQEALKKKKASKKRKYDSAWKNIIRKLFKDFLEFFFPEIYQAIDFTKEIHFLDKELNEIDPDSNIGDRVADVLVKVYLKDGSSKYIFIFIHLEVQSQPIQNFMEKMYIYNFRTFDLNIEDRTAVISVAILADEDANETLPIVPDLLPGPVGVGEAEDRRSHAVGAIVEKVIVLGCELVDPVHVDGTGGVFLVNRKRLRDPVDLTRRGVDKPRARIEVAAGLHQVHGRDAVDSEIQVWISHAVTVTHLPR